MFNGPTTSHYIRRSEREHPSRLQTMVMKKEAQLELDAFRFLINYAFQI